MTFCKLKTTYCNTHAHQHTQRNARTGWMIISIESVIHVSQSAQQSCSADQPDSYMKTLSPGKPALVIF